MNAPTPPDGQEIRLALVIQFDDDKRQFDVDVNISVPETVPDDDAEKLCDAVMAAVRLWAGPVQSVETLVPFTKVGENQT